jgi:hypothetical protein
MKSIYMENILRKKILFLEKSANTNTFSLLSANTNGSSGIGAFLEPIPPIP